MGLQVWIPMNGNLNNYGLGLPFIENHEAQIYDHGKIGKCYKYANSYTVISSCLPENPTEFSICAWVCLLPNFNKNNGCHLVSIGNNLRICVAKNSRFVEIITHNATDYFGSSALSSSIKVDTWYHIGVTYKSGEIAIYINGEKDTTHTISQLTGVAENVHFRIGSYYSEYSNALINDYRIYDTCLSPRQVKEISKGLICHYPLGEIDGKIGGRNLIKNGKGNVKAGFFKNFSTVTDEYAEFTIKSKKTYSGINLNDGFVYECREYDVGEKYTWSYDIMYTVWNFPTGSNRAEFWMGQRYTIAPSGETATGTWSKVTKHNLPVIGQNGCELNKWYHVKQTVTIPDPASSNVKQQAIISFYNSNADVEASFTARIKNVKLEKSSTATPWTPAPEDDTSFYDNIIYDTSGYCNNGSITDSTCPTWSSDTPRYKGSYVFDGNKQYVTCGTSTMIQGQEEMTINCWAYMDDWSNFNARLFSCTEVGGYNTEKFNSIIRFTLNIYTASDKSKHAYNSNIGYYSGIKLSDMSSGWHMITCVYKASVGDSMYLDGKLYEKKTYTSYGIHFNKNSYLFLGGESAGVNCIAPYFNGKLSDFRIYVTALDNQTIEELYKVGASVDSSGNLYAYGFNEN